LHTYVKNVVDAGWERKSRFYRRQNSGVSFDVRNFTYVYTPVEFRGSSVTQIKMFNV